MYDKEPTGLDFVVGRIGVGPAARRLLNRSGAELGPILLRHVDADCWGDDELGAANRSALLQSGPIKTMHTVAGVQLFVVTEADRTATTVMLPSEVDSYLKYGPDIGSE